VFEAAEREGIYVMLSLLNHGAFSTFVNSEWDANPYNAENGGPLTLSHEFFTDANARALFQRRLRYVVARFGWSTQLLAWELWNEVDLVSVRYPRAEVAAWHREMAATLRSLDPHGHLITSSHAQRSNHPTVWNDGGLDFTQIHFCADGFPPQRNIARNVTAWTATLGGDRAARAVRRAGREFGSPAETRAAAPSIGSTTGSGRRRVRRHRHRHDWWWDNLIGLERSATPRCSARWRASCAASPSTASASHRSTPRSAAPRGPSSSMSSRANARCWLAEGRRLQWLRIQPW
jgi:hypothetical protein